MSQTPETKNAFQITEDIQEQFVNGLAQTMAVLSRKKEHDLIGTSIPFSAASGREFNGVNMVRLILTSIEKGYTDNRWMTFKQIEQFQKENTDLVVHVRKGEKGTKILQSQEVHFIVGEDGTREIVSRERLTEIQQLKDTDAEVIPDVRTGILYYPYTVFNAQQIVGFPEKENPAPDMPSEEKQEFIDRFVASSGVQVEQVDYEASHYYNKIDKILMPIPERCGNKDPMSVSAMKLREFFHATGSKDRENRLPPSGSTLTPYAIEEMRGELFSIMAGQYLGIPSGIQLSAERIQDWNAKFSGNDSGEIFQAAMQAGKILTTLHQFKVGETPKAKWFPPSETWDELCKKQRNYDNLKHGERLLNKALDTIQNNSSIKTAENNFAISVKEILRNDPPPLDLLLQYLNMAKNCLKDNFDEKYQPKDLIIKIENFNAGFAIDEYGRAIEVSRTEQPSIINSEVNPVIVHENPVLAIESSKENKEDASQDLVLQARKILQNPEFLDMAMKQDPECVKELASLCDSMAMALSRELDEQSRATSAPKESVPTSHRRMKA